MKFLTTKLLFFSKEKDELSSTIISTQRDFDAYRVACKAKYPKIDENEISMLKTRINDLGNVLKECAFNNTKLEEMLSKKHMHTPHVKHDKPSHAKTLHVRMPTHHMSIMLKHPMLTNHMFKNHMLIMLLNMDEFMNVLIVADMVI